MSDKNSVHSISYKNLFLIDVFQQLLESDQFGGSGVRCINSFFYEYLLGATACTADLLW